MKKRVFSEEEIEKIIELYKQNYSINKIAKEIFHCRSSYISKILKANNVKIINSPLRRFTFDEEQKICKEYIEDNCSINFLHQKYNCSSETIKNVLEKNNIKIKIHRPKNGLLKDDFFEEINSEEKAYFLGFIFADGYIQGNCLGIEIHLRDKHLLESFKKIINSQSSISYRKRKNTEMVSIHVTSNKIIEDLSKYGIIENKTYLTKKLPLIKKELIPHFLRGLVDGDGWILNKGNKMALGFTSYSYNICKDFQEYCFSIIGSRNIKITTKGEKTTAYVCQFQSKADVKQLVTVLYKNNKICLTRKYAMAKGIFEDKNDEDIV